jgi:hypothetical protein
VRQPPHHSRDHEQHWEHVGGEAHRSVDDAAVEIDVRVEFSLDEVGVREGDAFQFHCDLDQLLLSGDLEDLLCDFLDDLGSGVVVLVDAVAEAVE